MKKGLNLMRAMSSSMSGGNNGTLHGGEDDKKKKKVITEEEKAKMKADPKFVEAQNKRAAEKKAYEEAEENLKKEYPTAVPNRTNVEGYQKKKAAEEAKKKGTANIDYMK